MYCSIKFVLVSTELLNQQNVLGGDTDVDPDVVVSEAEVAVKVIVRDMSSEIVESVVDVLPERVVGRILVISVNMIVTTEIIFI